MLGRSLLMKAGEARLLYPAYVQDYLDRVTAADVAAGNTLGLERGVTDAFSGAIEVMVANGILGVSGGVISQAASKIKAMCFMCGARTLSGCLVPVVGPAPTNFNFVSGDYDRKAGLKGNGTSKYLSANRANNVDPQNSRHVSVFVSEANSASNNGSYIASANVTSDGMTDMRAVRTTTPDFLRFCLNISSFVSEFDVNGTGASAGFIGSSRTSAIIVTARAQGTAYTNNLQTSATPTSAALNVFQRNGDQYSDSRIAFYSIGESLHLAVLDSRISTLMATLATAIP